MKYAFIIFSLIAVFTGMSVLGFGSADCGRNMSAVCCAISLVSGERCVNENQLWHINFHMNALKSFSLAVVNPLFWADMVLIFFAVLYRIWESQSKPDKIDLFFVSFSLSRFKKILSIEKEYQFWLALHENSPALI